MKTHILLVDDDIDEMKIFVEALKDVVGAFKCTYASNGGHALKMLLFLRPQVIFADYNMPLMNGLDLAKAIREVPELKHIPLFLYSTHINIDILQKAKRAGVTGCMVKPNTIGQLSEMLKTVLPSAIMPST